MELLQSMTNRILFVGCRKGFSDAYAVDGYRNTARVKSIVVSIDDGRLIEFFTGFTSLLFYESVFVKIVTGISLENKMKL